MENKKVNPQRFLNWLNQYWKGPKICPICGNSDWLVNDKLWEMREFTEGTIRLGGPILPLGAVQCKNCGNMILFNAIITGFMNPTQDKDNQLEESSSKNP